MSNSAVCHPQPLFPADPAVQDLPIASPYVLSKFGRDMGVKIPSQNPRDCQYSGLANFLNPEINKKIATGSI